MPRRSTNPGKSRFRLQVLARFRLLQDGQELALPPRARDLLGLLVLAEVSVDRARIAADLWPDSPTRQSLNNLRNLLYNLRKDHLELADSLEREPGKLELVGIDTDLQALQTLLRHPSPDAAALVDAYPGHLCPVLDGAAASSLRQQLATDYLRVAIRRVEQLEAERRFEDALPLVTHILRIEPYFELGYRALMRINAAQGDIALALRAYEACREAMEEGVGELPDEETRALARQLASQTPRRRHAPSTAAPFVGRAREWSLLSRTWQLCLDGHAFSLGISGPAGVGKTRLLEEFAQHLGRLGHSTALVTALELQQSTPFALLASLQDRLESLTPRTRTRLDPPLSSGRQAPPQLLQLEFQQRVTDRIRRQLPLCVIIDDAQWCDLESLAWLQQAILSLTNEPLLWLIGHTPLLADSAPSRLQKALTRQACFTELELTGLSDPECLELLSRLGGTPPSGILEVSEGNPLALTQLVRHSWTPSLPLPAMLAAAFDRQLIEAGPARPLCSILALARCPLPATVLESLDFLDVDAQLERLLSLQLVQTCPDGTYRLLHGLLSHHLTSQLSELSQRRLHAHLGRAWLRSAFPPASPDMVAAHLEAGGLLEEAVEQYGRAAEQLVARGSPESAITRASRAVDLAERSGLPLVRWKAGLILARSALAAGNTPILDRAIEGLRGCVPSSQSPLYGHRLRQLQSQAAMLKGRMTEAAAGLKTLARTLDTLDDDTLAIELAVTIVSFFGRLKKHIPTMSEQEAEAIARQALESCERRGARPSWEVRLWWQALHREDSQADSRQTWLQEAGSSSEAAGEPLEAGEDLAPPARWRPALYPQTLEPSLSPRDATRLILEKLSTVPDIQVRAVALDFETQQANRRGAWSLATFLTIARSRLLSSAPLGVEGLKSQLYALYAATFIHHPRRVVALARAFAAQPLPTGSEVIAARIEIYHLRSLLLLGELDAVEAGIPRLDQLLSRVGEKHPVLQRQVEHLKRTVPLLRGPTEVAIAASESTADALQSAGLPAQALAHRLEAELLRFDAGKPLQPAAVIASWVEEVLRHGAFERQTHALALGQAARAYALEGNQPMAEHYRQRAGEAHDRLAAQLVPGHRAFFDAVRPCFIEGRMPLGDDYPRGFETTHTPEEQEIADRTLSWSICPDRT